MALEIEFINAERMTHGDVLLDHWAVLAPHLWQFPAGWARWVLIDGLARRRDAELAMAALVKCGVPWTSNKNAIWAAATSMGGAEKLHQIACEALQW